MCILTLSASVPAFDPPSCVGSLCPSASPAQFDIFFVGLYMIALGTGGIKPCVSSFGADQFDDTYPTEREAFSLVLLFIGSENQVESPITRMCQVLVASLRKWNVQLPHDSSLLFEVQDKTSAIEGSRKLQHSDDFKCLDRAATVTDLDVKRSGFSNPWLLCTVTQAEELKIPVRMFPIWATIIVFSSVYAQMPCLFVEQGMVLDNSTGSLTIPPASLSATGVVSVMVGVPIYDRILVPFARRFTGKEKGFSELQRMGQCLFISVLAMIVAALVEVRRLRIARENGQVHVHKAVPVSILWQIPHYYLVGAAEIFTFIGQPEFFYDQSPDAMRSLCKM
ncbi:hypothetical protein ACLOJK_025519 [Asimina triloba]